MIFYEYILKHYYISVFNFTESEQNVVKKVVIQAPPPIQFVEGVIVAVKLPEPCIDVKNFKKSTKANVHVKYVDIKEGQSRAHIRFDNTEFAKQVSNLFIILYHCISITRK